MRGAKRKNFDIKPVARKKSATPFVLKRKNTLPAGRALKRAHVNDTPEQEAQPAYAPIAFPKRKESYIISASEYDALFGRNNEPRTHVMRTSKAKSKIASFLILALIGAAGLQAASIIAASQSAKIKVIGSAQEALSHLQEAKDLTAQRDFLAAQQQFEIAQSNFQDAQKNLDFLGAGLSLVLQATPQGRSAGAIVKAGQEIAAAGLQYNNFYKSVSGIKIGADGFTSVNGGLYELLGAASNYLEAGNAQLGQADNDLASVDFSSLPAAYSGQFSRYKSQLDSSLQGFQQAQSLLSLFRQFFGRGIKTVLVLFENNNELRPTGGFIGTYGFFKFDDGKIISSKIASVYDLDGQIPVKIAPPGPFHDLTDHWGMRDSNWFADFQKSAQKTSYFYDMTGMETPDAVIALTPDVFVQLLQITGPVYVPQFNITLSSDNFREQVQLNTSVLYDKRQNQPKQLLADFEPIFLQALEKNDKSYAQVLGVLLDNLYRKNILFYDRNPSIEKQFEAYNWAGTIQQTDRDYLDIVNANLGGRKTDIDVQQSADLQSQVQPDGSIINTLTYTRTHNVNFNDFDNNIDYVRFLVPHGSRLVSATGFDIRPFYKSDGRGYVQDVNQPFKIDPDLQALDKGETFNVDNGVATESESGKTSFAGWMETGPGQRKTVTITYKLPFNINESRKYSLLLQKQPGNNPIAFKYNLLNAGRALWYTPDNLVMGANSISYSHDLIGDTLVGAVLDNQH